MKSGCQARSVFSLSLYTRSRWSGKKPSQSQKRMDEEVRNLYLTSPSLILDKMVQELVSCNTVTVEYACSPTTKVSGADCLSWFVWLNCAKFKGFNHQRNPKKSSRLLCQPHANLCRPGLVFSWMNHWMTFRIVSGSRGCIRKWPNETTSRWQKSIECMTMMTVPVGSFCCWKCPGPSQQQKHQRLRRGTVQLDLETYRRACLLVSVALPKTSLHLYTERRWGIGRIRYLVCLHQMFLYVFVVLLTNSSYEPLLINGSSGAFRLPVRSAHRFWSVGINWWHRGFCVSPTCTA